MTDDRFAAPSVRRAARSVALALALCLVAAAPGGCGPKVPAKPLLYQVRGRAVDTHTGQGLASARVLLRAAVVTPGGTQVLSAYAVAGADGKYTAELSEGFDIIRHAAQIRIDISKHGYATAGLDLPPPDRRRDVYPVPNILLVRTSGPAPAPTGPIRTQPPPVVLPWKR